MLLLLFLLLFLLLNYYIQMLFKLSLNLLLFLMLLITFTTDALDGYEMERWVIIMMSDLLEMIIIIINTFIIAIGITDFYS